MHKKIKRLYYRKIKYAHVYAEQSRRVRDSGLSTVLSDFSSSEYNQAVEFRHILQEKGIKTSNLLRILVEMNSAWTGIFSMGLGTRVMLRYNKHLEKRAIYYMNKLNPLNEELECLIRKFQKEDEEHKIYFSN